MPLIPHSGGKGRGRGRGQIDLSVGGQFGVQSKFGMARASQRNPS